MATVANLSRQLTIAQELAIQSQLNSRLYGVLQSLIADLTEHTDWGHFSAKVKTDCLYREEYGRIIGTVRMSLAGDYTQDARKLSAIRQSNKRLRATIAKLVDEIDAYSDPEYFTSWAEAMALIHVTPTAPALPVAVLRF